MCSVSELKGAVALFSSPLEELLATTLAPDLYSNPVDSIGYLTHPASS